MIDFAAIRDRIPAIDAAREYGMEFDRTGKKARCIFHPDHEPSMSFRDGRFRCWSCGASGTSLDLTAQLFGLSVTEAARRLNEDFRLGLESDRRPTEEEQRAAREAQALTKEWRRFEEWREAFIDRLNAVYRRGHLALKHEHDLTAGEAATILNMARAEYLADELSAGSPTAQAEIYRNRRSITSWTKKALSN